MSINRELSSERIEPKVVLILGMGFFQNLKRMVGLLKLWLRVRGLSSQEVMILAPRSWKSNPEEMAKFLKVVAPNAKIMGVFYSYGGGWYFRRLQKWMVKVGLRFAHVVLIDPVVRVALIPVRLSRVSLLSGLSLLPFFKLKILAKAVAKVSYYYQRENLPAGHELVIEDPQETKVVVHKRLALKHSDIDDSTEIHDYVILQLRSLIESEA